MEIIKINDKLYLAKNVMDKKTHEIYDEACAKTREELESKFQDVEPEETVDFLNPDQSENQEQPEENTETINIL